MKPLPAKYHNHVVVCSLLAMAVLYALLVVWNHLCFRTYGLDLGIYTKALYDYAHLNWCDCSFYLWERGNLLGDHFDLLLVLLSPLVYLFGDWTLLLVQVSAVLCGGYGVYRLMRLYYDDFLVPWLAMMSLLISFGVWHALSFDYHSNVVAAMLLPWLLYCIKRGLFKRATAIACAMAICKETSAIWLLAVLVALLFDYRKSPRERRWLVGAVVCCLAYVAVVTLFVMPVLIGGSSPGFWCYKWMGSDMGSVALWILCHPLQTVSSLFVNFTGNAAHNGLKLEFFCCIAASGMAICLLNPNYLIMLLPPLAMKMLSSDAEAFWGVGFHYNVEIAVVVTVGSFLALARIKQLRWRHGVALAAVLATCMTLFYTTAHPRTHIWKENVRVFDSRHYHQPEFDTAAARRMLNAIPRNASVCATTMFTPHLATRDSVYIFPMGLGYGAEYYLLLREHWCYYEGEEEQVVGIINDTARYRMVDTDGFIYLMQSKE